MGKDRDATQERVTIQEAARRLGVKEDAIRKRIQRGSMRHEKAEDGRVYVWVDATQDTRQTTQDTTQDERFEDLKEQIGYLRRQLDEEREARRRADTIIAQLARANEEQSRASRELEGPQETSEAAETVEEAPEGAELRSATGNAQEATHSAARPSIWLPPVERLPWWHYVLGICLVVLATYLSNLIIDVTKINEEGPYAAYRRIAGLVLLWANPGVFGFWVGFRLRNLRLRSRTIPLGAIVGLTATIITLSHDLVLTGLMTEILNHPEYLLNRWRFVITALSFRPIIRIWLPSWLLFVSAAMVGNAWQRRHIQHSSGTPPDWTTRQQAILGWSGTIISALISLIGTIITVWSGA